MWFFHTQLVFRIFEAIEEHRFEKKLNIETTGSCFFKDTTSAHNDNLGYQPAAYLYLKQIVQRLKIKPEDKAIDFGCGKGRAVCYLAMFNPKKVVGVEINQEMIDIARRNLKALALTTPPPIELIQQDAACFEIQDENIFFFFNPFGPKTLQTVIENIKNSLILRPRRISIVYYSPVYRNIIDKQDWLMIDKKITSPYYSIWENKL
jgi:SAM-dependent methyltransferase